MTRTNGQLRRIAAEITKCNKQAARDDEAARAYTDMIDALCAAELFDGEELSGPYQATIEDTLERLRKSRLESQLSAAAYRTDAIHWAAQ